MIRRHDDSSQESSASQRGLFVSASVSFSFYLCIYPYLRCPASIAVRRPLLVKSTLVHCSSPPVQASLSTKALHLEMSPMAPSAGLLALLCGVLLVRSAECSVGLCYGMLGDNLPPPAEVVALFRQHTIPRMRIYFPSPPVLAALRNSDIALILEDLSPLSGDQSAAEHWLDLNVVPFFPDVDFRYIAVGNELIPRAPEARLILAVMNNLQNALVAKKLEKIKVSTVVDTSVLGLSFPPSASEFTAEASTFLRPITLFLEANGSPLLVNVYPYFAHAAEPGDVALDYALFMSPQVVVSDGTFNYQNLFDASVDSVYVALEKIDAGGIEIVVSESGWPSDGGVAATVDNARTYDQTLVRHVGNGTPRRPGKEIEAYLFATFNENKKAPGTEQNFGLFYPNKQPVYPIEF